MCFHSELQLYCVKFVLIIILGVPSALVIISDPVGNSAYEYVVSWDKPETGGMAIVEYRFKLRQV